jgi:tetratricopeptide (TPR) repeat protein
MSGFKALNYASDDESDVEVDDTKEIQVEEALKLYQSALKHHAAGPLSFEKAAEAYQQLFKSEIFQYPESQAELRRIELYGPLVEDDDIRLEIDGAAAFATTSLETGSSTLPQILHLSHKNYAQFRLDALAANLDALNLSLQGILGDAAAALDHFVQALDKDETDLDLWRRTATVGEMLDSKRVARFCLEAVLDGDDEGLSSLMTLPGLEDGLAAEGLRELIKELNDQLSQFQAPLPPKKRKALARQLKERLDPYHEIVAREQALKQRFGLPHSTLRSPRQDVLKAPSTWTELGDLLLHQLTMREYGAGFDSAISFQLEMAPGSAKDDLVSNSNALAIMDSKSEAPSPLPTTIEEQFPGLDRGMPTVQPQISDADPNMQVISRPDLDGDLEMSESPTMPLPTRKRSMDAAGLADGPEEGRAKSRRTRARESIRDSIPETAESRQPVIDANVRWEHEQLMNERIAADDWLYETIAVVFERIGIVGFEAGKDVRHELEPQLEEGEGAGENDDVAARCLRLARSDVAAFLGDYSDELAPILLPGGSSLDLKQPIPTTSTGNGSGASSSKPHTKRDPMPNGGLATFYRNMNAGWLSLEEVAYEFIKVMVRPTEGDAANNSYMTYLWPEPLKAMVVRNLVKFDESIFERATAELQQWTRASGDAPTTKPDNFNTGEVLAGMLQTIFELHLDIYCLIKEPNSGVDAETVEQQGYRFQRWAELAQEAMHIRATVACKHDISDELNLRFLWAMALNVGTSADVDQDFALQCMRDLRDTFSDADDPTITLQNNAVMPELSVAALDRRLSELTTKEFFAKVTENDLQDPVATIENLEPLLEAVRAVRHNSSEDQAPYSLVSPDLVNFVESRGMAVKLMLWQRLHEAYLSINMTGMHVLCYFRMMEVVLDEIQSPGFLATPQVDRRPMVLSRLRMLLVIVSNVFDIVQDPNTSADTLSCMDEARLKQGITTLGLILHTLQVFNVFEDAIQIGQSQPPTLPNGLPAATYPAVVEFSHASQLRAWTLLYGLLKEAIAQNGEVYHTPTEDRFDFLRSLHRNLGIRGICNSLGRNFVRTLKNEFFTMTHVDGYDNEQAQVLYDLYGLNCFLNPSYELIEHRCTQDAFMDRGVANQAVDLLLSQASKLPMKELVKHPLKDTIEKVHGNLNRKKPSEVILRNRAVIRTFLTAPINPLDLYGCLRGVGSEIVFTPVPEEDSVLASKGWYFLMGHIALTKFKSQKRSGQSPTEDLDIAIAFFNQSLEYSMDNWEVWFRLAQAHDTKIEEAVVWSAEKLNANMTELVSLQRAAIHCYTMATALAHRSADLAFETSGKMTELYSDFALRMYSSSREPFSMLPFAVETTGRYLSKSTTMEQVSSFKPLTVYTAWKLAKVLYQKALKGIPHSWQAHYMLGKCMWKMYSTPVHARGTGAVPTPRHILDTFLRSLELVPGKRDSRDTKFQPTLEPHYKLLSIVSKMLNRGDITTADAQEALNNSPYARSTEFPTDMQEWPTYVLTVLRKIRLADKSNWHHRMIAKAAQIIYDHPDARGDPDLSSRHPGAAAARHELTQQLFTKTMLLQVWRPDAERAGRHYVYMTQYTRFFIRILDQLKDRSSLEQLGKRVRKKTGDFFEHSAVWQEICSVHLRLLREHAQLSEGLETSTFSGIAHEEFLERKEPLEKWMQAQDPGQSSTLHVLREVQELKKTNSGLMKPGPIDDLIGDAYAYLFSTEGRRLWQEERRAKEEEDARRPPPVPSPPPKNPTMAMSHIMNSILGMDGAADSTPKPATLVNRQPAPTAAPAAAAAEPPAARRKIGVGRREIRTCAENCFPKNTAVSVKGPIPEHPRVSVVISGSRPDLSGEASVQTSAPGSVHDDADDESELSELEEEEEDDKIEKMKRPLFPGLGIASKESPDESEGFETAEEGDEDKQDGEDGDVEMGDGDVEGAKEVEENAGAKDEEMPGVEEAQVGSATEV